MFPFKGIYNKDFLPEGPSKLAWSQCRIGVVSLKELWLTQDQIQIIQLFVDIKLNPDDDDFVHVGLWNRQFILYNGHHRVVKAALKKRTTINARVYVFDD